ncbi:MAG TPA: hypothetical protein VFC79_04925 [Tissierellaceae bacterium]|jgi:hypothetical protein|nr:hypothetical protein [Tissierellaceae bacterium]
MDKHLKIWSLITSVAFFGFFILSLKSEIFFLWDIFVALAIGSLIIILVKTFKIEEKRS